ncbi:MAG: HAMP domain-containing protein [Ignavibacteriales bacterium]|nr:HAMP domain-containing protein [Ignavibacteriales bacterium]
MVASSEAYMAAIDKIIALKDTAADKFADQNREDANSDARFLLIVALGAFVLAIIIGIFISRIIGKPIKYLTSVATDMSKGSVDVDVKQSTTDEIGQLMGAFGEMIEGVKLQARAAEKIADGDVQAAITIRSDKDVLNKGMVKVIETLKELITEAGMLSKAAVDGKLSTRGNAEKFRGGYKQIVQGVNDTLDSVIGPLNVAAEYVDRIAKGDIPKKISDSYNGDFNEIKNNLNGCIDAVNLLVADAGVLSRAAVEGKLATRADASKHQGDFRRIVQGVNDTLDSVIGPLNVAAEYVDRIAKGDIPSRD